MLFQIFSFMNTCNQSKGSQVETVQCLAGFIRTTSKCLLSYQYPEEGHAPLSHTLPQIVWMKCTVEPWPGHDLTSHVKSLPPECRSPSFAITSSSSSPPFFPSSLILSSHSPSLSFPFFSFWHLLSFLPFLYKWTLEGITCLLFFIKNWVQFWKITPPSSPNRTYLYSTEVAGAN